MRLFGFVYFLLVSGKGCGLWMWHSLDFSPTFFDLFPTGAVDQRVSIFLWSLKIIDRLFFSHAIKKTQKCRNKMATKNNNKNTKQKKNKKKKKKKINLVTEMSFYFNQA